MRSVTGIPDSRRSDFRPPDPDGLWRFPVFSYRRATGAAVPADHFQREPGVSLTETADVVVIGTGPGGAIPGYYLAAGGAKVVYLERGPWLKTEEFTHDLQVGTYTRIVDLIQGDGMTWSPAIASADRSVVYFAAALRAPSFVFYRRGSIGRRLWPALDHPGSLDPWYDRVEQTLPVAQQTWNDVPYAGGLLAAACRTAGWTCNPVPVAVDLGSCTNCNWMLNGCRFGAKRSMLLNYLPAALAHGAEIRPLHEVQTIARRRHRATATASASLQVDGDYRLARAGTIEAKVVVLAAGAMGTPVILQRSARCSGGVRPPSASISRPTAITSRWP